jgi:hypothetical protein
MWYTEGGTAKTQWEIYETSRNSDVGLNAMFREYPVPTATTKKRLDVKNYFAAQNQTVSDGRWTDFLQICTSRSWETENLQLDPEI